MAAWDTLPPMLRVSDADRDRVIRLLREGIADGRLSQETFVRRVDLALRARNPGDLASLLRDLPPPRRRFADLAARAIAWWSSLTARLRSAWDIPRPRPLVLPRGDRTVFTIGRAWDADLTLQDMTVSWRHAELRRTGTEWVLVDLGSTNGTRANGWRAGQGITVRPGDCVSFGRAEFRLASPAC